jgi:hypothetical protein
MMNSSPNTIGTDVSSEIGWDINEAVFPPKIKDIYSASVEKQQVVNAVAATKQKTGPGPKTKSVPPKKEVNGAGDTAFFPVEERQASS